MVHKIYTLTFGTKENIYTFYFRDKGKTPTTFGGKTKTLNFELQKDKKHTIKKKER